MHGGMPYDLIQGQGHGASEVPKIALFNVYLLCHLQWELANDLRFLNDRTVSKFVRDDTVTWLGVVVVLHGTFADCP